MKGRDVISHFAAMLAHHPERAILTLPDGESTLTLTWRELLQRASGCARAQDEAGVREGELLPIFHPLGAGLIAEFVGAILLGAIPCVFAPPNPKISTDVLVRKLHGMLGEKPLHCMAVADELLPFFEGHVQHALPDLRVLHHNPAHEANADEANADDWLKRRPAPDAPCFLQHSSGTSGTPKAVVISHRQITEHLEVYGHVLAVSERDRIASWLPLYHDMGMVACLWGSLLWNIPSHHIDNLAWVYEPRRLFDVIANERSTLCWLPNFAFNYLSNSLNDDDITSLAGAQQALASVRAWVNCSEPVMARSFDAFAERFAGAGVTRASLSASYAMAENVFAVTQTTVGHEPPRLALEREALEREHEVVANAKPDTSQRAFVSSGRVLPGVELALLLSNGTRVELDPAGSSRFAGEILLRGPYALRDYYGNDAATANALRDGWYHTGDIGFLSDGELYVIGRSKDLIIVAGRNVDPGEIEFIANQVEGVIPGRVCCLGIESATSGTEELHLIVESDVHGGTDRRGLIARCKQRVALESSFQLRQVWCRERGWLVKSTSGKIARSENRARLIAEEASLKE